MKKILVPITFLVATLAAFYWYQKTNKNTSALTPITNDTPIPTATPNVAKPNIEVVTQNLNIPWEVAFLPNGDYLITERPGTLLRIGKDKQTFPISGVNHVGEGGLLGLALHPNFLYNRQLYLYLTSQQDGKIVNRIERYQLINDQLTDKTIILENIPGAANHDGGRIEFGPDGYLYVTTGDAQQPNASQMIGFLSGKILRVEDDGSIPEDNPFNNEIYSYGHRNPQGITWDNEGNLWATEHGRSGIRSGFDELNLITRAGNYGWPKIQGGETAEDLISPIIHSGDDTWAPAGAEFVQDSIFFVGLKGQTLYQAQIIDGQVTQLIKHFVNHYGRLRAIRLGPDGYLYITTSNTDGRGEPKENDDKLIRINTDLFFK